MPPYGNIHIIYFVRTDDCIVSDHAALYWVDAANEGIHYQSVILTVSSLNIFYHFAQFWYNYYTGNTTAT
jgi:hypothetical protein